MIFVNVPTIENTQWFIYFNSNDFLKNQWNCFHQWFLINLPMIFVNIPTISNTQWFIYFNSNDFLKNQWNCFHQWFLINLPMIFVNIPTISNTQWFIYFNSNDFLKKSMKLFSPMISNKFTNDCQKSCDFIQWFPCKITSNDIIVVTTILNRWNFKKSLETIIPVAM